MSIAIKIDNWLVPTADFRRLFSVLTITSLAIISFRFLVKYLKALRMKGNLPGPPIYPIILNDYVFWSSRPRLHIWRDLLAQYGDTVYVHGNSVVTAVTVNPDNIQHIVSENKKFSMYKRQPVPPHNRFYRLAKLLFGQGIFFTDDEIWSIQRTHANPMFKVSSIKEMIPIFLTKTQLVLNHINNQSNPTTNTTNFIDVQNLFMKYTLDSFGEIGFGTTFGLFTTKEDTQFPSWFDKAQRMILELGINPIKYFFQVSAYEEIIRKLDSVVYNIIEERLKTGRKGNDLLSKFLELKDESGKSFPKVWIRDIVMNFLIAGRDTTATLLTWTVYYLSKFPEVYEKACEDLRKIEGEEITFDNLQKLNYIDYVMKESMRFTAPVPGVTRVAHEDDVLPDGHVVRRGTRVRYWTYFLHRSPKLWEKPEEFIPERWENQKSILKHSYQYLPFHSGPTSCIGRKMAELEAKVMLVALLRQFRFSPDPAHPYEPFLGIITNCEGGCPIQFQQR